MDGPGCQNGVSTTSLILQHQKAKGPWKHTYCEDHITLPELHTFMFMLNLSRPAAYTTSNQQYLPNSILLWASWWAQLKPALAQWSLQEIGGSSSIQLHSKSPQRKLATQCMISQVRFPPAVCIPASPEPGKEMFPHLVWYGAIYQKLRDEFGHPAMQGEPTNNDFHNHRCLSLESELRLSSHCPPFFSRTISCKA